MKDHLVKAIADGVRVLCRCYDKSSKRGHQTP